MEIALVVLLQSILMKIGMRFLLPSPFRWRAWPLAFVLVGGISLCALPAIRAATDEGVGAGGEWIPLAAGDDKEARHTLGFSAGGGLGSFIFGGTVKHDFVFLNFHYGLILPDVIGEGSWWEGRWMMLGEATAGQETHPEDAWAASLTPVVRYLFGHPASVVPFLEAGIGLTWTEIGEPDLGGELQFNSQGGAGFYWFAEEDLAFTIQYRFIHYSNAGLRRPNGGVNIHAGMIGISYFF